MRKAVIQYLRLTYKELRVMCFEIMLSALTEDDRSFVEKLYLEYGDYMYSVAYGVLKHRQDAEDAVNDAMCKII